MYICNYMVFLLKPTLDDTIFIFSILNYIEKTYNLSPEEFQDIIICYFNDKNITIMLEEIKKIKSGDTLFSEKNTYDIIIGNPPYVRAKNLDENYLKQLRKIYHSCKKGY